MIHRLCRICKNTNQWCSPTGDKFGNGESFSDKHKSNINIFDYSFFIFAIHLFLLECVQKAFYIKLTHSEWVALIDYILSPMITICICVVIGKLIQKMSYPLYKILGGR